MKPGKVVDLKMQSAVNRMAQGHRTCPDRRPSILLVLLVLALVSLACSRGFVSSAQLTATAGPGPLASGGNSSTPVNTATTASSAAPTASTGPSGNRDPNLIPAQVLSTHTAIPDVSTPTVTATAASVSTDTPTPPPAVTTQPSPTASTEIGAPQGSITPGGPTLYYTQAGDTLAALALRFDVDAAAITSPDTTLPSEGLLNPGILALIPTRLKETSSNVKIMPDSEIVYSPSALDFNIADFINRSDGFLDTYKEWRSNGWYDGAGIVNRVAMEDSINPRLLLAVLEYQSHWVNGQPNDLSDPGYPIGFINHQSENKSLYYQLNWTVQQLNLGYYGWRDGSVTELTFPDGTKLRMAPDINAGTASILYLFSRLYNQPEWNEALYGSNGFITLYKNMFGDPWQRAQTVEPLFPATLTQPPLEFPFLPGHTWSFTGGPHGAWNSGDAPAAIDFAPSATVHGCYKSDEWVTASTSGLVVRSGNGVVVVDLDGDGYEQTGWNIMYLHIASEDRIPLNTWVNLNDPLGHPSCEGGLATGTHVHIARKYNGEWILAGGPLPFNFSGWIVHWDHVLYQGSMTKGGQVIHSSLVGTHESLMTRPKETP